MLFWSETSPNQTLVYKLPYLFLHNFRVGPIFQTYSSKRCFITATTSFFPDSSLDKHIIETHSTKKRGIIMALHRTRMTTILPQLLTRFQWSNTLKMWIILTILVLVNHAQAQFCPKPSETNPRCLSHRWAEFSLVSNVWHYLILWWHSFQCTV